MTDNRVFYGPYPCPACTRLIVKASREQGGEEFDQPEGPIYPNTAWARHKCVQKFTVVNMLPGVSDTPDEG
jgi:hypothetical protein